jgi:2-amino-4-hydroxy-6-hydroxymethyldihydropteridine diphosphokinase
MQVYLALGSNLGDREAALVEAKDLLMKNGVMVVLQSSVLETAPLGGADQPDYLNQVLECETELGAQELLKVCQEVEVEMGRDMKEKGGGESRVIDIDILFYGDERVVLPGLTIPHPGVRDREFWIAGLKELGCVKIDA